MITRAYATQNNPLENIYGLIKAGQSGLNLVYLVGFGIIAIAALLILRR